MLENGVVLDSNVHSTLETIRSQGKASILVAVDEKYIGIIALSDVLRPEAANMVARLTAMQTGIVLLTGDNQKTADYFASRVGITEVRAELLPEEKVSNIAPFRRAERLSA